MEELPISPFFSFILLFQLCLKELFQLFCPLRDPHLSCHLSLIQVSQTVVIHRLSAQFVVYLSTSCTITCFIFSVNQLIFIFKLVYLKRKKFASIYI